MWFESKRVKRVSVIHSVHIQSSVNFKVGFSLILITPPTSPLINAKNQDVKRAYISLKHPKL